jgi:hypothetical protein
MKLNSNKITTIEPGKGRGGNPELHKGFKTILVMVEIELEKKQGLK